jgi:1-acyl-sn-glycerol-3-phosphate acyltransferase
MRFIPQTDYIRPEHTDEHTLKIKRAVNINFDDNYPYNNKRLGYRFVKLLMRVLVGIIGFPVLFIVTGFIIKGKKNLRKNRKLLKNGFLTVCNHVHLWDSVGVMTAFLRYGMSFPSWDMNMRGSNRFLIKYSGGIPVPKQPRALLCFVKAVNEILSERRWVHFFPEGSMWDYYAEIRPFKKGAFTFAVNNKKPVIPLAYSYRRPRGIWKLFRKPAALTLNIGEPIFFDETLPKQEAVIDICIKARAAVMSLAGIEKDVYSESVF